MRNAEIELAIKQNDYATADARYQELDGLGVLDVDRLVAWGDVALKNDALDFYADARSDPEASDVLRRYYKRAQAENPHPAYEQLYINAIYPLGLKSRDATVREKYLRLARAKLEEVLKLASKADVKSTRRVAGTLETLNSISEYALTLVDALQKVDANDAVDSAVEASGIKRRLENLDADAVEEWRTFFDSLNDLVKKQTDD